MGCINRQVGEKLFDNHKIDTKTTKSKDKETKLALLDGVMVELHKINNDLMLV